MRYFILLVCFGPIWLLGQDTIPQNPRAAHRALREGDRVYLLEKYADASQFYQKALDQNPTEWKSTYNLANAKYKQGQYEAAGDLFEKATKATKNPQQLADAWHNLGNAQLQQKKYGPAVQSYQQALRNRPGDAGTKANLQLAKKKLREQQQQQKDQQQPNKGDQPPPPPQEEPTPPPQPEQQPTPGEEQALRYINAEDQKNRRKYQEKTNDKPSEKKLDKDW